jgi:hypothetical protein
MKCKEYLNTSSKTSNIINLCKYIINNSEKNCILKIKSLSSLSKKAIFKITNEFNDNRKKDLYFYGNTRINEIINYLNNYLKCDDDEYFTIKFKNDKNIISLDEFDSNKTLNELNNDFRKKEKKFEIIITKENFSEDKLLDQNNNLTERFNIILENWFKLFSKDKGEMNLDNIADCFNKLSGKEKPFFTNKSVKIYSFLKIDLKKEKYEKIILQEFKTYFQKSCQDKYSTVKNNIKNMNLAPDLTEKPKEIDNNKIPRYYLSNIVNEYKESYLFKSLFYYFNYSYNEDIFDFMSSLSVNGDIYKNIIEQFNYNNYMKFTQKKKTNI